ncbi:ankyrin-3-like [Watersipora subatra]|uniref:ankyrin-3-like n=1 Tax=Watersipora subatra TaxID=2589382 RepID=UPI00355C57AE
MSANEESVDHLVKLIDGNKLEEVKEFVEGANDAVKLLTTTGKKGYLTHVEELVVAGASPTYIDQSGEMPIHKAARNGHSPVVVYLLTNGGDVNPSNKDGYTPLMLAVCGGHLKTTLLLLENEADITCSDNDQNSLLALSILNHQEDIVPLLLDNEVNPNSPNSEGNTPLHIACQLNQPTTVEILLDIGVEPDAVNNLGQTALHIAATSNNHMIVGQLISAGVQTDMADNQGKLAVDLTTQGELIAMITAGVASPPAPQREKTILEIDLADLQRASDPSTTTNTNADVYADNDSMQGNADQMPLTFHENDPYRQHESMTLQSAAAEIASHKADEVAPVYIESSEPSTAHIVSADRQQQMTETKQTKHRQPAQLPRHTYENPDRQSWQQSQHQGQFQQPIKVDKATVDTLRGKVKGLEAQVLTLGIGDDKAVVLYRQYGKLNEEISLARQMVRDYLQQHRPLTPRLE